jgi:hypothetical protein
VAAAMVDAPRVVVQLPAEGGPRIDVVGGGPANGIPDAYLTALEKLLDQLSTRTWQTWWSAGSDKVLEIGTTSLPPLLDLMPDALNVT